MKIIEALKQVKELQVKADDLRKKIAAHSAHLSFETPLYVNQKLQVREWLQAHSDVCQEIARLMVCISRTNLATQVEVKLGNKNVSKSITEWIVRRRTTSAFDHSAWASLTDRGLREGNLPSSAGQEGTKVTIVHCFDPKERDEFIELYRSEPSVIDRTLEVVNATTDLIEE